MIVNPRKFSIGNLFKRLVSYYKAAAIILVNMIVLFVMANLIGVIIPSLEPETVLDNIQQSLEKKPLDVIYPGVDRKQLDQLLKETWTRPYGYEPYTQFRERPYTGRYVNVADGGFRVSKKQGVWPPSPDCYNVFVFGGSTVFGHGVSDEQTTASFMQEELASIAKGSRDIKIYNFGRGNYYSTQERILFSNLLVEGFIPDMALFIDGAADFTHPDDRPAFSNHFEYLFERLNANAAKAKPLFSFKSWLAGLPAMNIVKAVKTCFRNDKQGKHVGNQEFSLHHSDALIIEKVLNRYMQNKKSIEALSKAYHVRTVFVWQPCPLYKYDLAYHLFGDEMLKKGAKMMVVDGYPRMRKRMEEHLLGDNFLWCADIQENVKQPLYVDKVHYTADMNRRLAKEIVNQMQTRNLLPSIETK